MWISLKNRQEVSEFKSYGVVESCQSSFHPIYRTHSAVVIAQHFGPCLISLMTTEGKHSIKKEKKRNGDALQCLSCCLTCRQDKTQAAAPRASSVKDILDRYLWQKACGEEPLSANGRLQAPQERWQQDNSSWWCDAESPPLSPPWLCWLKEPNMSISCPLKMRMGGVLISFTLTKQRIRLWRAFILWNRGYRKTKKQTNIKYFF